MNVLIIEDEPTAARRLERLLLSYDSGVTILEKLDSVETSVKWLESNPQPDLILMDIKLADGMSFDIFKRVDVETPVIFCTAFDNYAIQAFKVNSVDYLLKPIEEEALYASLKKFKKLFRTSQNSANPANYQNLVNMMSANLHDIKKRFLVKSGRKFISIPVEKIAMIYTENKLVRLVTEQGKEFAIDQTLDELERSLNPNMFYRANRQEIISINAIRGVEQNESAFTIFPSIQGLKEILVSRKRTAGFKQWMGG